MADEITIATGGNDPAPVVIPAAPATNENDVAITAIEADASVQREKEYTKQVVARVEAEALEDEKWTIMQADMSRLAEGLAEVRGIVEGLALATSPPPPPPPPSLPEPLPLTEATVSTPIFTSGATAETPTEASGGSVVEAVAEAIPELPPVLAINGGPTLRLV